MPPPKQLELKKLCFLAPIYQCYYYIYLLTCGTVLAGTAAQFWWQKLQQNQEKRSKSPSPTCSKELQQTQNYLCSAWVGEEVSYESSVSLT